MFIRKITLCFLWVHSSLYAQDLCSSTNANAMELSYEVKQPLPLVDVQTNKQNQKFLLDTGSSWTYLLKHGANKLSLTILDLGGEVSGVGGETHKMITKAHSFQIGNLRTERPYFFVLTEFGFTPYFDGILGLDYLLSNSLEIDIKNARIKLIPKKECDFDSLLEMKNEVFVLNYHLLNQDDIRPRFTLSHGEHQLTAIIDTGASTSFAHLRVAQKLGISTNFEGFSKLGAVHGVAGSEKTVPIRIKNLKFSNHELEEHLFLVSNAKSSNVDKQNVDLILGLNFLREYKVLFDVENKRLFIKNSK